MPVFGGSLPASGPGLGTGRGWDRSTVLGVCVLGGGGMPSECDSQQGGGVWEGTQLPPLLDLGQQVMALTLGLSWAGRQPVLRASRGFCSFLLPFPGASPGALRVAMATYLLGLLPLTFTIL